MKTEEFCHLIERGLSERIIPPALCLLLLIMLMASVGCTTPQKSAAPVYDAVRATLHQDTIVSAETTNTNPRAVLVIGAPNQFKLIETNVDFRETVEKAGLPPLKRTDYNCCVVFPDSRTL